MRCRCGRFTSETFITLCDWCGHLTALGLKLGASESEIKSAYRRIARECHPDTSLQGAADRARFEKAKAAREWLLANPIGPVPPVRSPQPETQRQATGRCDTSPPRPRPQPAYRSPRSSRSARRAPFVFALLLAAACAWMLWHSDLFSARAAVANSSVTTPAPPSKPHKPARHKRHTQGGNHAQQNPR